MPDDPKISNFFEELEKRRGIPLLEALYDQAVASGNEALRDAMDDEVMLAEEELSAEYPEYRRWKDALRAMRMDAWMASQGFVKPEEL